MPVIGLIKEGKVPSDNRVALSPKQCRYLLDQFLAGILLLNLPLIDVLRTENTKKKV